MLMIYDSKGRGYTEEEIAKLMEFINSEQEPVYQVSNGVDGWDDVDRLRYTACTLDPENYLCRVVYTHAGPSEVAQLRGRLESFKKSLASECELNKTTAAELKHALQQIRFKDEAITQHQCDIEAATQRADAAERKLANERDELLLIMSVLRGYQPCVARNDALRAAGVILDRMDASAEPAKPKCATCNDVGIIGHSSICPDCIGSWEPAKGLK